MTTDQKRLIEELIENLRATIDRKSDKIPEHWNGIELRNFVADVAREHFVYPMERTRARAYRNDLIVLNLV